MYMDSSWMEPDGTKLGKDTLSVEFKHKLVHLQNNQINWDIFQVSVCSTNRAFLSHVLEFIVLFDISLIYEAL